MVLTGITFTAHQNIWEYGIYLLQVSWEKYVCTAVQLTQLNSVSASTRRGVEKEWEKKILKIFILVGW